MAFAQNLEKCFHILTQGQTYTEEELCIKLEDALLLCNKFSLVNREIVILHNPSRIPVQFQLQQNWRSDFPAGSERSCMLADMLYVIYSPAQKQCRIFFIRNCRKKSTGYKNRFYTSLVQLDLLSSRSAFRLWEKQEECGILKDSQTLSVTNYGVFHKVKGCYDMQIYSADLITPLQEVGVEPRRVVVFRGDFDQRRISGPDWLQDYESHSCLRNFGRAIEDLMIGQPITHSWKEGLIAQLNGMDEMDIPADFKKMEIKDISGAYEGDGNYDFLKSVKSIVLINVDED